MAGIDFRDSKLSELLREASYAARSLERRIYLVGGALRDLLLGRSSVDIDLAVDGVAPGVAQELARRLGGSLTVHQAFGTATISHGPFRIDLATLRAESYAHPGALPQVRPGSLEDDLARRDFTINAMALTLEDGELHDPFGGRADLERRLIRVLHPGSFIDDATRILRALRYEARLGFRLEEETARLARRDAPMLHTISGDRLRHELEHILAEEKPQAILRRMAELGVLTQLHPSLTWDDAVEAAFAAVPKGDERASLLLLCLLCYPLTVEEANAFSRRLNLPSEAAAALRDVGALKASLPTLRDPALPPSQVRRLLGSLSPVAPEVALLRCPLPEVQAHLRRFCDVYRHTKPLLDGNDILALGVPQGPMVGQMLAALRDARLDGQVESREDEVALVERWLERGFAPEDSS